MKATRPMPAGPELTADKVHAEHETIDRVASSAHHAVDRVATVASDVVESAGAKGHEIKAIQEQWLEGLRAYLHDHPVQSVGIALAGGFLISRLMSRR
jgi:ElaB/YqjD/DUF883 family membrane-anchored ribosome-binding protein